MSKVNAFFANFIPYLFFCEVEISQTNRFGNRIVKIYPFYPYFCKRPQHQNNETMIKRLILIIYIVCSASALAQTVNEKIQVSDDIEIEKLSDNVYLHRSFLQTQNWGKIGANGLIIIKNDEALLIDTPWNNDQTKALYKWISEALHVSTQSVIVSHWHEDCMGGLSYLQTKGVKSYANRQTIELAETKGLPLPETGFTDSLNINFKGIDIKLYYPGGGHTTDNIIVWIPSENTLFGGCLVKDIKSENLGNLADANIPAWPQSIKWIRDKFTNIKTVIPGHGNIGDCKLLEHTSKLLYEVNTNK